MEDCYGHVLNLAVGDTVKGCEIADSLDIAFEVSMLISFSLKRAAQFEKLKAEFAPTTMKLFSGIDYNFIPSDNI